MRLVTGIRLGCVTDMLNDWDWLRLGCVGLRTWLVIKIR